MSDLYDYGEALARNGCSWQEVNSYVGTNKQMAVWNDIWPGANLAEKWRLVWDALKRMTAGKLAAQAPLIMKTRLKAMGRPLQKALLILMTTGLRVGSLEICANADYTGNQDNPSLYIRAIKYLPCDFNRTVTFACNCDIGGTDAAFCIIHNHGVIKFATADFPGMSAELRAAHYTWHSAKRTMAVFIKLAEERYGRFIDNRRLNRFFGWGGESRQMFNYYTRDSGTVCLEWLPELYRVYHRLLDTAP
jgi:hypothetical protein